MRSPHSRHCSHDELVRTLNPEQREAVDHVTGPILVLAGAGSGKTRVLTTRISHLVLEHGVTPERILAVTFTNKAAKEMRSRVQDVLGDGGRGVWLGTFHSFGVRLLRRYGAGLGWSRRFAIRDAEQSLREVKKAQLAADVDPARWRPKAVRGSISDAKNKLVGAEEFSARNLEGADPLLRQVARVYPVYQWALREQDAMDFDDLLFQPVRLLEDNDDLLKRVRDRYDFILVDEYQDTNRAQFRLLELLAGGHRNLMVVGDDDQSIYGWRGADIRNILGFEESFPGARVVRLEQNYRSTQAILDAANRVIRENQDRKTKSLRTQRSGGAPLTCLRAADEADEAGWVVGEIGRLLAARPQWTWSDAAVLYRTNAQARALEDGFRRAMVPYQIVGGVRFYERREIQDILAYLRLIANPRDMEAFDRIVNYPRRGIGAKTLARLRGTAISENVSPLAAAARCGGVAGIRAAARRGLRDFADLVARYSRRARRLMVGELLEELIEELGLIPLLQGSEGGAERAENIQELVAAAHTFDPAEALQMEDGGREGLTDLDLFLQHTALVTDLDGHDSASDAVTLMTVHNAKGLEFDIVFVSGMEEGLFPLSQARDQPRALEEERRLFYVAVTRAREHLYVTHADTRWRSGGVFYGSRSSFMDVLEGRVLDKRTNRARFRPGQRAVRWNQRNHRGW